MFLKIFLIFFLFLFSIPVVAKEKAYLNPADLENVGINKYESINPNLLIYPFKRVGENIKLYLTFDKVKKVEYELSLYDKRLKELTFIVDNNKIGFVGFSVDRYNSMTGTIKRTAVPLDKNKIQRNIKFLEKLRDRYHSSSAPWEKLQQAVDVTKSLI